MDIVATIFALVSWLGLLVTPLVIQRYWIAEEARQNATRDPLTMFLFSFFSLMICGIAVSVVMFFFTLIAMMNPFCAIAASIIGTVVQFRLVWILHGLTGRRDNAALERRAVTRYQIWMQDLFVGALVLGAILTGYAALRGPVAQTDELAFMIFGEVLAIIPALFIGLSVLRFHPHATKPKMRVLWVAGFMLAGSIPFVSLLWMLPCWFSFLLGMSKLPENAEPDESKMMEPGRTIELGTTTEIQKL